ncbi:hypothetical protein PT974_05318 [Cladobotryum mycophilum]|uniref:NAD-dependent epimerase/dehydratase domain-containing protein n=1 Tax=Cladobotryum mycophilum TaxID=491253 RepID=A0ABR0SIF1_9HYPO
MARNILITGASGYLGGELAAQLAEADLPPHGTVYALVRTDEQSAAVKALNMEPLTVDVRKGAAVEKAIVDHSISIVFWLIDALNFDSQLHFIKALSKIKEAKGFDVHFVHTSGAKIFSSHTSAPTDRPLLDTDVDLYDTQKKQEKCPSIIHRAVKTNNTIIEQATALGVRSYIFAPCIVYGKGRGFGNPISIQTTWPVSHISDTGSLYIAILRTILAGGDPGHGKNGYFLAASGSVAWDDIYTSIAVAMKKRGIIQDSNIRLANDEILEKIGVALGSSKQYVPLQLGGSCSFTAKRGEQIGWKSQYGPEHILEALDDEVEFVLQHI